MLSAHVSYIPIHSKSESNAKVVPTKVKSKPDSRTFVQFRISLQEHETLLRIAQTAFNQGGIKRPTISAFARASLMSMANVALRVEQENVRIIEYDRRRKELQALTKSK